MSEEAGAVDKVDGAPEQRMQLGLTENVSEFFQLCNLGGTVLVVIERETMDRSEDIFLWWFE